MFMISFRLGWQILRLHLPVCYDLFPHLLQTTNTTTLYMCIFHIPYITRMHTMFNTNKCTIFRCSVIQKVSCNMFWPITWTSSERYKQDHSYNYRSVRTTQFGVINSTVYIAINLLEWRFTACLFCAHHP